MLLAQLALIALGAATAAEVKSLSDAEKLLAKSGELSAADAEAIAKYLRPRTPKADQNRGGGRRPIVQKYAVGFVQPAAPTAKCEIRTRDGHTVPLRSLGDSGLHAAIRTFPNFTGIDFQYFIDGKRVGQGQAQIEEYDLPPDCLPKPDVPKGEVIKMPPWTDSKIFPGTKRDWWVYVPKQYDASKPAALFVFQDGGSYVEGDQVPVVLDNLIAAKKIPVMIGVFINPGAGRSRGDEYDTCTPRYAEFLEKEILPDVARKYKFSSDPKQRAIGGASSGASCAFTAAWHRPDLFGRVLSHIGSYCDFRGLPNYPAPDGKSKPAPSEFGPWKTAHDYPPLIRKTRPVKPIRVFLQDGRRDLDNQLGNWPLANEQMAAALRFSGYKCKFVMGEGFHNHKHGRALLPESLVWLWSDE